MTSNSSPAPYGRSLRRSVERGCRLARQHTVGRSVCQLPEQLLGIVVADRFQDLQGSLKSRKSQFVDQLLQALFQFRTLLGFNHVAKERLDGIAE
jgi:hypothetical protein